MKKGDKIWITCEKQRVKGWIILVSPNQVSLMIGFEAMLSGHVGMMPILRNEEDGIYRALFNDAEVKIEARED